MYQFLFDNGLLEGRHELIDGVIITKMPVNPPHCIALIHLRNWLIGLFGLDFVQTENPTEIPGAEGEVSEPEPDIVATR